MKISYFIICILSVVFSVSFTVNVQGQCLPGFVSTTTTSETTVSGFGTDFYNFNVPQFNPSLGTLLDVKVETVITLNFGFYFENGNIVGINRNMRVTRFDDYSSAALGAQSPVVNNAPTYNTGIIALAASDGIQYSGPDYFEMPVTSILNNYTRTTTVTDISPFVGTGSVSFDYNSSTFNAITNGPTSNITTSNTTEDVLTFRVIYTYCAPIIVPSTVRNFTLQKQSPDKIRLSWLIPNDVQGKEYIIEKSTDGRNFSQSGKVLYSASANGNYNFLYGIESTDKGYLLFRIKEINADGSYYYSAVRSILIEEIKTGVKVYPTLVKDYVQVIIPAQQSKDVLVRLVSASGQVLQQKRSNTNTVTMNFEKHLPQGVYFVQVTDMRTRQQFVSKIFAQ